MKPRLRALIVDDEPLARRTLEGLLAADPEIEVCGSCADGKAAVAAAERERPDLLLLDIQMPGMNGFEVLETLSDRIGADTLPFVIFVTAYDRYALRAFDYHALDYLLKPFSDERFARALDHAKKEAARTDLTDLRHRLSALLRDYHVSEATRAPAGEKFPVKADGKVTLVDVADIVWFEAADHYVLLHTERRSHICRESMSGLESRLDPECFVRVHRSAIVNVDFIEQFLTTGRDEHAVRLKIGKTLRISRRRAPQLKEVLGL